MDVMPLEPRTLSRARQPNCQHYRSLTGPRGHNRRCGSRGRDRYRWRLRGRDRGRDRRRSDDRRLLAGRLRSKRWTGTFRSKRLFVCHPIRNLRRSFRGSDLRCDSRPRGATRPPPCCGRSAHRSPPSASAAASVPAPPRGPIPALSLNCFCHGQLRRAPRCQLKIRLRFFLDPSLLRRRTLDCWPLRRTLASRVFGRRMFMRQMHWGWRRRLNRSLRRLFANLALEVLRLQRLGAFRRLFLRRSIALLAPLHPVTHPFPHIALLAQCPVRRQWSPLARRIPAKPRGSANRVIGPSGH